LSYAQAQKSNMPRQKQSMITTADNAADREKSVAMMSITVGVMTNQITFTICRASFLLSSPGQAFPALLQTAAHMRIVGRVATIYVCDSPTAIFASRYPVVAIPSAPVKTNYHRVR
jgi:hypothetical protein